jgi:hypothetical protein
LKKFSDVKLFSLCSVSTDELPRIELQFHVQRLGISPTTAEQLELEKRRQRLRLRIERTRRGARDYIHDAVEALEIQMLLVPDDEPEDDWPVPPLDPEDPEHHFLPLASAVPPRERERFGGLHSLLRKEYELREGVANDSLQKIKESLSYLAWQYKGRVRHAEGNRQTGRAWDVIRSLGRKLRFYRALYNHNREIMINIKNVGEVNRDFPPVTREECRVNTVVSDPNARGQSRTRLAWFWYATPYADEDIHAITPGEDEYMTECNIFQFKTWPNANNYILVYRLHWLRARAQANRWTEELNLTKHEMEWTVRFYMYMARKWKHRRDVLSPSRGHHAYAEQQIDMWNELGRVGENLFRSVNREYLPVWSEVVHTSYLN